MCSVAQPRAPTRPSSSPAAPRALKRCRSLEWMLGDVRNVRRRACGRALRVGRQSLHQNLRPHGATKSVARGAQLCAAAIAANTVSGEIKRSPRAAKCAEQSSQRYALSLQPVSCCHGRRAALSGRVGMRSRERSRRTAARPHSRRRSYAASRPWRPCGRWPGRPWPSVCCAPRSVRRTRGTSAASAPPSARPRRHLLIAAPPRPLIAAPPRPLYSEDGSRRRRGATRGYSDVFASRPNAATPARTIPTYRVQPEALTREWTIQPVVESSLRRVTAATGRGDAAGWRA